MLPVSVLHVRNIIGPRCDVQSDAPIVRISDARAKSASWHWGLYDRAVVKSWTVHEPHSQRNSHALGANLGSLLVVLLGAMALSTDVVRCEQMRAERNARRRVCNGVSKVSLRAVINEIMCEVGVAGTP
jgi:hypothetical protein